MVKMIILTAWITANWMYNRHESDFTDLLVHDFIWIGFLIVFTI